MKKIIGCLFLVLGFSGWVQAQHLLKGTVRDAQTKEVLPFVSILINDGPHGATSDINGKFEVKSRETLRQLTFSYLGYEPQKIQLSDSVTQLLVKMKPQANNLREVVIRAGFNPAHRIIKLATANRKKNDPAQLPEYTYRVYTKTVITYNVKEVEKDTFKLVEVKPILTAEDSSKLEMEAYFAKHYLFLTESIADHAFIKPNLDKETVLATRVSGLQNPTFAMLSTDSKNFSVYQDMVTFFGKSYLGPLSEGSTKKYDFQLEDTTYTGNDTVFIISYKPLPGKNFEGLKGQLHISSDGWAVANIIAESAEESTQGVRLQQHYEKIGQTWFPVQVHTDYDFKTLLNHGYKPVAYSRSYYSQINLKPELKRREFKAVTIKMQNDAARKPEAFWNQHRPDSLSFRERNTYHKLDSLGKEFKMDARFRLFEALYSKQLPLGPVSVDLNRIYRLNRYERFRFGLGLHTNDRISRFFTLGGYAGYGVKDKAWKYGGNLAFNLYQPSNLKLTVTHSEDIAESGGTVLPFYNAPLLGNNLRHLVIRNMDKVTHQSIFLSARIFKYMDVQTGLQEEHKRTTNGYTYEVSKDNFRSDFRFTEAVLGFRYAFREQLMEMFNNLIPMGTNYPIVWFQYRQGLNDLMNGQFAYQKYSARIEKNLKNKALGTTSVVLTGGLASGNIPYPNLFNGNGAEERDLHLYTSEGFQTMLPEEFLSDRYVALYVRHNFSSLLYRSEKFSPKLAVITNVGFGSLKDPQKHRNIDFKTMEKGYYESGLLVNDLVKMNFSSFGIGAFYRYGAYQQPTFKDNLSLKFVIGFTL
ncbi:DUF5686 and carboxypeptidase-like regulatory domain-containing protein [Adhaeribacter terreus]|uniref:DUF5686 family protein n=1 Tax=Adhaeribacter terreus TaxID=529703 RepID=A0ABW0ECJ7_9BACT